MVGLAPGGVSAIAAATLDRDGRAIELRTGNGRFSLTSTGLAVEPVVRVSPMMGLIPGGAELIVEAAVDDAGAVLHLFGDLGAHMQAGPGGLRGEAIPVTPPVVAPLATFDAAGSAATIPSGSLTYPNHDPVSWAETTVTSPAMPPVIVTDWTIAGVVDQTTLLPYEEVVSIQEVRRASDSAVLADGVDYTVDLSRGRFTNLSGEAMKVDLTGAPQRTDLVSIDPAAAPPVPTLTTGTAKERHAQYYPPDLPSRHTEIARVRRYGPHCYVVPHWDFRNGRKIGAEADEAEALSRNKWHLAPFIARLQRGQIVRVVANGNSRVQMGGPKVGPLNTTPNSIFTGNTAVDVTRDTPAYYANFNQDVRSLFGFDTPNSESFDLIPGFNLASGTPDGLGAAHSRGGYVWEFLKELNRMYPTAPIEYMNMSISGTNSGSDLQETGFGNALYPERWDATQELISDFTDVHGPGSVLYIPVDNMNELSNGGIDSSANWRTLANGAKALGAVVHFMGNGRPDQRFINRDAAMGLKCRDQVIVAIETDTAVSDAWRFISPDTLRGIKMIEDDLMDATDMNHEGPILQRATGRDAARSYL
jgi:hypothetical protein